MNLNSKLNPLLTCMEFNKLFFFLLDYQFGVPFPRLKMISGQRDYYKTTPKENGIIQNQTPFI